MSPLLASAWSYLGWQAACAGTGYVKLHLAIDVSLCLQGSLPNGDSSSLGSVGTAADLYNNLTLQNKGVGGQLRSEFSVQEADFPALSGTTGQRQGEEQDGQKVAVQQVSQTN